MKSTTHSVQSGNAELQVQEMGAGDPFVLVHGYTGSSIDWTDVAPSIAADGRRIVSFDHRGHGHSSNTGDAASYTIDQLTSDLAAVVDTLELASFDLLGHSMGGIVAMRFALANPGRLRSLVLMDTSAQPMSGLPLDAIDSLSKLGREQGMSAVYDVARKFFESATSGAETGVSREQRKVLNARLAEKFEQLDPVAFGELARALTDYPSMLGGIAGLQLPVTVLVGALDRGLLPAAEEMARVIPGARHVIIEDAGHCPQEDRPEAWLEVIRNHLGRRS